MSGIGTDGLPGTNGAPGVPQGGSLASSSGTLSLINSILSANSSTETNIFGAITDAGHNISFDNQNTLTNSTSFNGADPILGPLANNGGPTPTMALLPGSPAIDAGDPHSFPATDQRGQLRPSGPAPDIGAFEYSPIVLSGNITGLWPPDQAAVLAGASSTITTNGGTFVLPLSAGTYTLSPSNANYIFSPASQNITVGNSGTNVSFQAYRINAINLGTHTNGVLQFTFAGSNGQSFRILSSSNLTQWTPLLTNALGPAGFLGVVLPPTNSFRQFYRIVSP